MLNIKLLESKSLKFSILFSIIIIALTVFSYDISLDLNFSTDEASIMRGAEAIGKNEYFARVYGIDVLWLILTFFCGLTMLIVCIMLLVNQFVMHIDEAYKEKEKRVIRNLAAFLGALSIIGVIMFAVEIIRFNMYAAAQSNTLTLSPDFGWFTCLIASILFFIMAKISGSFKHPKTA
jgi:cytochrome bd-type quinol oxidase subunit 2